MSNEYLVKRYLVSCLRRARVIGDEEIVISCSKPGYNSFLSGILPWGVEKVYKCKGYKAYLYEGDIYVSRGAKLYSIVFIDRYRRDIERDSAFSQIDAKRVSQPSLNNNWKVLESIY